MPSIVPIPAVNASILNEKGKILLTRRSQSIREPGKWCLPGGHLDGGEDWLTAVARETLEETGLIIQDPKLIGIYSDPALTVTADKLEEGYRGQFVVTLFLITKYTGEVSPNEEVDAIDWFSLDNLPSPMIKSHPIRIEDSFRFENSVFVR